MSTWLVEIVAAAGGGSGGFGGGGGGGGGFSGGGGGAGGGSGGGFFVLVIFAVVFVVLAMGTFQAWSYRRRRRARAQRTALAATEAATDDADFAPETVEHEAAGLFLEIQRRWSENDIVALERLVAADLMVEWRRRLEDFQRKGWHNHVEPQGHPQVEYLGLVNRDGEEDDRVVVRITAKLRDYVIDRDGDVVLKDGERSTTTISSEWWTLRPPGERWTLMSIEQELEGRHQLDAELVATPWGDGRVRDAAVVETAVADALPAGTAVAEIAPAQLGADARAAALDLALADGRFAPDVLEVAARRAVEAWVEAVDGADAALDALADRAAVDALLYGGDGTRRTRVVVRGARVAQLTIATLDPHATPATMTALVTIAGRRYVEDRDTADVLAGNPNRDGETTQRWTFALRDDPAAPWRLVAVT